MKIMVVEDNIEISYLISEYLKYEGYDVSVASNGKIALEMLSKQGMVNMILLDMMMPVMDGMEFASVLNLKYPNHCPIVVMSAAVDIEKRAREINAVAWISKPLPFKEILSIVNKYAINNETDIEKKLETKKQTKIDSHI